MVVVSCAEVCASYFAAGIATNILFQNSKSWNEPSERVDLLAALLSAGEQMCKQFLVTPFTLVAGLRRFGRNAANRA